jgi:riboflavin kinase/FMN adenylyltransferase
MRVFGGIPAAGQTPVALTIGNFDGVHLGHQAMLRRLKEAAHSLGVPATVMTFEPHPREVFNPAEAPARLTSLREKLELFRDHGVDQVYLCRFNRTFAAMSAEDFIQRILIDGLQVKWVLIGDDFRFGARRAGNYDMLCEAGDRHGFAVIAMHSVMSGDLRASSTAVRDALAAGDIELANRLLDRPYSISGRVVHGDKAGRKLGWPTANVQIKHNRPPLAGIFAVDLHGLGEKPLAGVASLGVRPTLKHDGRPTLEVHIFGFQGEIYGRHVRVDFLHKLRDERKFPSLDALVEQIGRDVEEAKEFHHHRGTEAQRKA